MFKWSFDEHHHFSWNIFSLWGHGDSNVGLWVVFSWNSNMATRCLIAHHAIVRSWIAFIWYSLQHTTTIIIVAPSYRYGFSVSMRYKCNKDSETKWRLLLNRSRKSHQWNVHSYSNTFRNVLRKKGGKQKFWHFFRSIQREKCMNVNPLLENESKRLLDSISADVELKAEIEEFNANVKKVQTHFSMATITQSTHW